MKSLINWISLRSWNCAEQFYPNGRNGKLRIGLLTLVVFLPVHCIVPQASAEDSQYHVLAQNMVVKSDAISPIAKNNLLEVKNIVVNGFRTARLSVQVLESDYAKNQGGFTAESKLRVTCFHKIGGISFQYYEQEIPMKYATYINGWVEIPIIGPELRLIVWGENIPKTEQRVDCSIYLLK